MVDKSERMDYNIIKAKQTKQGVIFVECKRIKATFGKAGGTAAKNNQVVRIVIPADWVRKMKLTKENAYLEAEFENGYITLFKEGRL